jgi:glycosyltransferase involved in cell wall biosynthesis
MNSKKVCIVTLEYPPEQWGGLARTVENVATCHARDMGLEVHVAHLTVLENATVLLDENRKDESRNGVMVHRLQVGAEDLSDRSPTMWDFAHTRAFKMMYQSLELLHSTERFDLFHSFFLYPTGYITGLLAQRMQVPSIVTLVGNDIKKYIFCPEMVAFCRSGLENADSVVALSFDLLHTANALFPVCNKGRVIFNSVQLPPVSWRPHPIQNRPFHIGCAGIFKYAKGLPYLFKAIKEIRQRHDVILQLAGTLRESERQIYETMVEKTGIGDILNFQPALPHDRMPDWLCSLDAFVLSSVSEGCPNILMEAMACGLPCVATRVGAVEELMEDAVSGHIVAWGDSVAIADALERIIQSPDQGLSLGSAARKRMKQFSSKRERKAWRNIYADILQR